MAQTHSLFCIPLNLDFRNYLSVYVTSSFFLSLIILYLMYSTTIDTASTSNALGFALIFSSRFTYLLLCGNLIRYMYIVGSMLLMTDSLINSAYKSLIRNSFFEQEHISFAD